MPKNETLLKQLKRIIEAMRAGGRQPLRIYVTYSQLEALRNEIQATGALRYKATANGMAIYGIPVELTPVTGTGLWVSCVSD